MLHRGSLLLQLCRQRATAAVAIAADGGTTADVSHLRAGGQRGTHRRQLGGGLHASPGSEAAVWARLR